MRELKECGPTIKLSTPSGGGGSIDSEAVEEGVKKVSEGLGEVERAVLVVAEEARDREKTEVSEARELAKAIAKAIAKVIAMAIATSET